MKKLPLVNTKSLNKIEETI